MNNFKSEKQRKFVMSHMSKPMQVEALLKKVFNTPKVEYNGRSHQTNRHIYFINAKAITPEINSEWTKNFRNASSMHIAKGVNQDSLRVTADVSQDDVDVLGKDPEPAKEVEGFIQHIYPPELQHHQGFISVISRLQKNDKSNLHNDLEHADSIIKHQIGWQYKMGEDDSTIRNYEKAWRSFHLPRSYFNRDMIQKIDEDNNGSLALVLKKIYKIPYGSTTIEDYGEKRRLK